jgi:hypothetical protein
MVGLGGAEPAGSKGVAAPVDGVRPRGALGVPGIGDGPGCAGPAGGLDGAPQEPAGNDEPDVDTRGPDAPPTSCVPADVAGSGAVDELAAGTLTPYCWASSRLNGNGGLEGAYCGGWLRYVADGKVIPRT